MPPEGLKREDVENLLKHQSNTIEIRSIDRGKVPEVVHLKLLIITFNSKRKLALIGSSNFTQRGIPDKPNPNVELNVLIELNTNPVNSVSKIFEDLWKQCSKTVDPDEFARNPKALDDEFYKEFKPLKYQERVFNKLCMQYDNRKIKGGGAILSLPTGAGKTVVATKFLATKVLINKTDRALWIAPHEELLLQARSTFARWSPFLNDSVTFPTEADLNDRLACVHNQYSLDFMTTQTAYKNLKDLSDKYKVVIIDEAHYGASRECKMLPRIRKQLHNAFF